MKKFMSILLALTMMFSLCVTAFAEDTTLIISGDTNREYVGYQLLNLTTSLKADGHHTAHEGAHSPDCYNYAYTVNEKYRAILQAEVFANGGNYLWESVPKPADASGITDAQILKYFENQSGDDAAGYHTMRQVADRLYLAIKNASIAADKASLDGGVNNTIEQGYWMIADVSDLDGEHEARSLVMVDTAGQDALTINPKTALPTVEKKVKDIDDSEDDNILDNPWHDSADHDIGDTVPFKLTATLPVNAQYYTSFEMIFHDTMSKGLTFKDGSVKVYMYETKHKADVDTDLHDYMSNPAMDVTANFNVTYVVNGDKTTTLTIGCDDLYDIYGVTKDSAFVVYYETTLNEEAVIGDDGNPNEVYLEYSNDPYGDSTGESEKDKVVVYTYQLVVNKTDSHGHALKGAGFTLYKKNLAGEYLPLGGEMKGADMTTFTWTGLDDGDYKLEESTVPEGYNKLADILFSISAQHSETAGEPELISLDGGLMGLGVVETGMITKDIVNNTGTVLPETGAAGTMMLIGGGTLFVMLAAVFMITRKKMSIYED